MVIGGTEKSLTLHLRLTSCLELTLTRLGLRLTSELTLSLTLC